MQGFGRRRYRCRRRLKYMNGRKPRDRRSGKVKIGGLARAEPEHVVWCRHNGLVASYGGRHRRDGIPTDPVVASREARAIFVAVDLSKLSNLGLTAFL